MWMGDDFDLQRVSQREMVGSFPTKLQVAVHYAAECSNDAIDSLTQAYENHFISDASSVVPRYEVLVSTGYRSLIDFSCEYVPVHLLDFPVVELNGRKYNPAHPMVVIEAIVHHDETEYILKEKQGGVYLASLEEREIFVHGVGLLSNKQYWGSKWQCTAIARTSSRRCSNKTHHSSGRGHLRRDFPRYPQPTKDNIICVWVNE
jgi:hypothetical protein